MTSADGAPARLEPAAVRRPADPQLHPWPGDQAAPCYRLSSWEGHRSGAIAVDSANIPCVARVRGGFDVDLLEQAFLALVARHEALTAHLFEREGRPWLSPPDRERFHLERLDLVSLAADGRETALEAMVDGLVWRRFELLGAPLFRAFVIAVAPDDHVFGFVLHHFVGDTASSEILAVELVEFYQALARGEALALPPVLSFRDYLLCIDAWRRSGAADPMRDYWRETLARPPAIDFTPGPGRIDATGRRQAFSLDASIAHGLEEAARGLRTTTFCLLLAAQKAMLARVCGVDDVTILAVNGGREFPLLERTVGYMADRTFYRTDVGADPSFAELVERVRQTMRQADRRQFWRYDLLQEDRGVGAMIAAPAFNYYRRDTGPPTHGVWARIQPFPLRPPPGRSDPGAGVTGYWCVLTQEGGALRGQVRYRGDFPVDFPAALAKVLEQVCRDPRLPVSRIGV